MNSEISLSDLCRKYRGELFEKFLAIGQGHPGSTFSIIEIVVSLYHGGFVRFDEKSKKFLDRVVISKGHATVALYPILANFGVLPEKDWKDWGFGDSSLRIFGNTSIPGIDVTSGSLGHGIGVGAGMALASRLSGSDRHTFVIISEGELYEGSTWEAALFALHYGLDNLTVIIDINSMIIMGATEKLLKLEPIEDKVRGFGFDVETVDGHDIGAISNLISKKRHVGRPLCILAKTIKGKGFSIMENVSNWHYCNPLTEEQIEKCRREVA
jgi:transketolase